MSFGGVNVILVGDQGQLIPVGGTPCMVNPINHFVSKEKLQMQISRTLLY